MATATKVTIEERVLRGAAWMDEHFPGWAEKVNTETIDQSSSINCVMGQATGDVVTAGDKRVRFTRDGVTYRTLELPDTIDRMGFLLEYLREDRIRRNHDRLHDAWTFAVLERLAS